VVVVTVGSGLIAMVGTGTAVAVMGWVVQPLLLQAVTVRLLMPVVSETGQLKVPLLLAVVEQSVVPVGSVMATRLPGVAVPVMGWIIGPGTKGATVRLAGPVAVKLVVVAEAEPPGLIATAVNVCGPGATLTTQE
jgi:hypothetical protein